MKLVTVSKDYSNMAETTNRREWEGTRLTNDEVQTLINGAVSNTYQIASGQLDPTQLVNLDTILNQTKTGSGSVTLPTQYNDAAADEILTQSMLNLVGYLPDEATKKSFRAGLKAFMKQYGSRASSNGKSSQTTTGLDADAFVKQFVSGIVRKSLSENPNLELGGQFGESLSALSTYANAMGLFKTQNEISGYAADIVTGARNIKDITSDMRKQAVAMYSGFSKRLQEDANLTVRDLANPYIQMMSNLWEQDSNGISLLDDTLQKAINGPEGLMSLSDFRTFLRGKPQFEKTLGAKQEAFELAGGFARAFGFGASI